MHNTYLPEIAHARTWDAISALSLSVELDQYKAGDRKTRNYPAVTKVAQDITLSFNDLCPDERSVKHLLLYLRAYLKVVELTKTRLYGPIKEN